MYKTKDVNVIRQAIYTVFTDIMRLQKGKRGGMLLDISTRPLILKYES